MSDIKEREAFMKAARSYQATRERVQRRARQHSERMQSAPFEAMATTMVDGRVSDGGADDNAVLIATSDRGVGRTV